MAERMTGGAESGGAERTCRPPDSNPEGASRGALRAQKEERRERQDAVFKANAERARTG